MDDKQKSRAHFDRHSSTIINRNGYWSYDYKITTKILMRRGVKNLIDIGCGPGGFLCAVQKRFPDIQLNALDLSEEMVRETQERLGPSAVAIVGDSEHMPLESERYEIVTCNMSIHHYPHAQDAVNEMYRILKPGGTLLLNDMDCASPIRALANWAFPRLPGGDVRMYTRREISQMIQEAGFERWYYRKISPFSFLCTARKV